MTGSRAAIPASWVAWARIGLGRGLATLAVLASLLHASVVFAGPPDPSGPASPTRVEVPPSPTRWVSDRAGVLSPATQRQLDQRLHSYERDTGHQVIVWIDESTGGVPIETFAVEAFEAWRLGRAQLDDGLAVIAMVEDRTIRIEVGYGLEATVTDLIAARVIREIMIPSIEVGDWDRAMGAGVEALIGTIEGRTDALAPAPAQTGTGGAEGADQARGPPEPAWYGTAKIIGMVILVIGFVILLIVNPRLALMLLFFVGRGGGRGGGGGGGFGGGGGRSGGGGSTGRW
jgi:uncharacterized protein